MAKFEKAMTGTLLDSLLPVYGNPREDIPVWDAEQKMYICDEYTSANGNRYYRGVRLSDNIAVLERIGQWHNWTSVGWNSMCWKKANQGLCKSVSTARPSAIVTSCEVSRRLCWRRIWARAIPTPASV